MGKTFAPLDLISTAAAPASEGRGVSFQPGESSATLEALWTARWHLLAWVMAALCAAAAYGLLTPPVYRADALIQLEEPPGTAALSPGMRELMGGAEPRSLTEIEIIRSRMVLGEAAEALNLRWEATPRRLPVVGDLLRRVPLPDPGWAFLKPYAWHGEEVALGRFSLPEAWHDMRLTLTSTGAGGFLLDLPDGRRLAGRVGAELADTESGVALFVTALDGAAGREFTLRMRPDLAVVESLRKRLRAVERGRQTSILEISFQAPDPARAQAALAAILSVYVAQNVSRSSAEAQSSLDFIASQLPEAEAAVVEAQERLNAYRQSQLSVDLAFETEALLTRATEIEAQLNRLQLEEEDIRTRYTPNHRVYRTLLANRAQLEEQLAEVRAQTAGLPETQKEIFNLTREVEVAQEVYVQMRNRAQELRVIRASTIGNVRVIDRARAPASPIAPRMPLVLVVGALAGLCLGLAATLLGGLLRRSVQDGAEIEAVGLPVFATINRAGRSTGRRAGSGPLPILASAFPDDLAVESLRSLRTALHFGMLDSDGRALAITSPAPEAGKSFVAVNLAAVAAQSGLRVCLVDADMRRGYLRRYLSLPRNTPGLAEHLAGQLDLEEALHVDAATGLTLLPAGRYPPNPSELLMRRSFRSLVSTLGERYDLVILDTPPALAVTDSQIVARHASMTLAVIRHDRTLSRDLDALQAVFRGAGLRLQGAILNDIAPGRARAGAGAYRYAYGPRHA